MALIRRSGARFTTNIWPGFVDAMAALLLVLVFVLSIFMIVQSILRDTITGQRSELVALTDEVLTLQNDLGLEKLKLASLDERYEKKMKELRLLELNLTEERKKLNDLNKQFADRSYQLELANSDLGILNSKLFSLAEQLGSSKAQLNELNSQLDNKTEDLNLAMERSEYRLTLISGLRSQQVLLNDRVLDFEEQVASLIAEKLELKREILGYKDSLKVELSNLEQARLVIAESRKEIDEKIEAARLAASRNAALEILIQNIKVKNQKLVKNERIVQAEVRSLEESLRNSDERLTETQRNKLLDQAAIAALRDRLKAEKGEISILTLALAEKKNEALRTLELLASSRAVMRELEEKNKLLLENKVSMEAQKEARRVALLEARAQLLDEQKLAQASLAEVSRLTRSTEFLSRQLEYLQGVLDESEENEKRKNVQIESLGNRLNAALAKVATEQRQRAENLETYRSEFFGKLRKILGEQEGIQIVGDRFVFASEVLFGSGSDVLETAGQKQLDKVAKVILQVSSKIPTDLNWILRVDGHTDKTPLVSRSRFYDNWELSQARALSVVRYLIYSHNMAPNRLVAAGFGEYQPLSNVVSEEALAKNRRIELKLTER